FPVNLGPEDARLERCGNQQVVDTHAKIFVEVAGAVVPPRVAPRLRVAQAVGVNESPSAETGERLALALRDVRSTMTQACIPYIDVFGRDIEIAAEHNRRVGIDRFIEPSREPIEPDELGFV